MNTFSNNSTFNGWRLPGSGTWVTQDSADNFYVDENGDLWMPCVCGEGDGDGDGLGRAEEPADDTGPGCPGEPAGCRVEYAKDTSGDLIYINYPEAILYYPGRRITADGKSYAMGMLADNDKGRRWCYKGTHNGKVRLYISQTNMTAYVAIWDAEANTARMPSDTRTYDGVALHYAVVLENTGSAPAAVTIRKQGASMGRQPNMAQIEYFRSQAEPSFTLEPGARKWLYLGRSSGALDTPGACRLVHDEDRRMAIGTRRSNARFEVQADLEFSAPLTVTCFAYHEKNKVDFNAASMWPLPRQTGMPEGERLKNIFSMTTGVSPVRQLDGNFLWTVDDSSYGSPAALEVYASREPNEIRGGWITNYTEITDMAHPGWLPSDYVVARDDIVPFLVPVASPAGAPSGPPSGIPPDLDRMLFAPPPPPITTEIRDTANFSNLANWGVVYRQMLVIENKGTRNRRARYFVTSRDPEKKVCLYNANENKALSYVASNASAPDPNHPFCVADIIVPGGESRLVEIYFILGASNNDGLGHRLTVTDAPA